MEPTTALGIAKIAQEALKPLSEFIDVALAPKIENLRQWSTNQNLAAKAKHAHLHMDAVFAVYLKRLLTRISSLKTIVFPQIVLALPDIYEPLAVCDISTDNPVSDTDLIKKGARHYLIDNAGMGKSTFVKYLILSQLADNSVRIPLFYELRRLEGQKLIDAIASDLSTPEKKFDTEVLTRLLSKVDFVIILDGFDEIPTAARKDIARQVEELEKLRSSNAILVTSRHEVELPILPKSKTLSFTRLSNDQAENIVKRYDTVAGLDIGERLIEHFETVPEVFLSTPLLLTLLYRTYGFNNSISKDIASFYEELFLALYKGHDLTKAEFNREKTSDLDCSTFRRLFRGFSFLAITEQLTSFSTQAKLLSVIETASKATRINPSSSENFFKDLLLSVPLLVRDGTEFRFIHKTIAECFAAEYVAFDSDAKKILPKIYSSSTSSKYIEVIKFLKEIQPILFRQEIVARIALESLTYRPEQNAILRTINFLLDWKISFWEKGAEPDFGNLRETIDGGFEYASESLLSFDYSKVTAYCQTYFNTKKPFGSICMDFISKEIKRDPFRIANGTSLEEWKSRLPFGIWISGEDPRMEQLVEYPEVRDKMADSLRWYLENRPSHNFGSYRVLDAIQVESFLSQLKDDEETNDMISAMI